MTDHTTRYEQLSDRARFYLENLDELDLAEACASSEAEIARLRAGEDSTPTAEAVELTAAQWLHRIHEADPELRLQVIDQLRTQASEGRDCRLFGHKQQLSSANSEVRRLGLMVDEYGQGASQMLDKVTRVRKLANEWAATGQQLNAHIDFADATAAIRSALD